MNLEWMTYDSSFHFNPYGGLNDKTYSGFDM